MILGDFCKRYRLLPTCLPKTLGADGKNAYLVFGNSTADKESRLWFDWISLGSRYQSHGNLKKKIICTMSQKYANEQFVYYFAMNLLDIIALLGDLHVTHPPMFCRLTSWVFLGFFFNFVSSCPYLRISEWCPRLVLMCVVYLLLRLKLSHLFSLREFLYYL